MLTVMLVAGMDEVLLQTVLDLLEDLERLFLGLMWRTKLDGACGCLSSCASIARRQRKSVAREIEALLFSSSLQVQPTMLTSYSSPLYPSYAL